MTRLLISLSLFVLLAGSVVAGLDPSYSSKAIVDTVPFYADGTYNPNVPHPNDLLDDPIGQWPLRYSELVKYLEALDGITPRVKIEIYGQTHEDRDLFNVFISSEVNMA
ncbi:MAG: hypothetical protein J7J98_02070, partial [candidate division Zixibacteria bacterium]|nr:hypothetical protein [candidate division Zixibacteria bacterium]